MQYKEFTESHSKNLIEQISSIMETHMIGRTVIVKGKKGRVIKQVGSDGKTESDEIYQVKFEDGTVADIPARDMEMQGDDNKKIGENEAEELVKEAKRKPKGKSYKTGDDSYVDTELSRILGTKKPKSGTTPNYPAGDHPGLDPDLQLDHLEWPLDESLGGPGGPSREMSPNDMYTSGLRTKALLKKLRVKTQSGTTERVSRDDLEAAGDVFDRIKRLKLAIADKQHAAHQKKADKSRIRQRKWGDSVEYDGEHLDERNAPLPKSNSFSSVYSYAGKDHKFVTKLTNIGGVVDRKRKEVRFNFDNAAARTRFRNKNKNTFKGL